MYARRHPGNIELGFFDLAIPVLADFTHGDL